MNEFKDLVKNYYNVQPLLYLLCPEEKFFKFDNVRKECTFKELEELTTLYEFFFKKYNILYVKIDSLKKRDTLIEEILMLIN